MIEPGLKPVHSSILPPSSSASFFLARDGTGRAVMIEYDIVSDEKILFQALEHLDWLSNHLPLISQLIPQSLLIPTLNPRLLLVIPQVPPSFEKHLKVLTLSPEFFTFMYLAVGGESGLFIQPQWTRKMESYPSPPPFPKDRTLTDDEEAYFKGNPGPL
jgi:hypothetical protein